MALPISILAMQTVTPAKVTPSGTFRRISLDDDLPPAALAAHFRLILYYQSTPGENSSALAIGARMKETFSMALADEPMFAGRLRRSEGDDGAWEVRFNDAGVRLVVATTATEMKDVLEAGDREEREWGLVFWKNVEREYHDQCALCYIQVTEFRNSSYSIGISCSFLLADPLHLIQFLLKWAPIHRHVTVPVFFLSTFKPSPLPLKLTEITPATPPAPTLLFRCPPIASHLHLASGNFLFLRRDHAGDLKMQFLENSGEVKVEILEENSGVVNAGVFEKSDEIKVQFLENSGEVKVGFLENSGEVKVGFLDKSGEVKVGLLEENSDEVKVGLLDNSGEGKVRFLENSGKEKVGLLENSGEGKVGFLEENSGEVKVGFSENSGEGKVGFLENSGEGKVGFLENSDEVKVGFLENSGEVKVGLLENSGEGKVGFLENSGEVEVGFLENSGEVKVGFLENSGEVKVGFLEGGGGGKVVKWEEMGLNGLELGEESELVGFSCRVVSGGYGTGLVVVMVGDGSDVLVSVTVPAKTGGNRI